MTSENSQISLMSSLDPELRVGVPSIDNEHLALISELNRLIDNPRMLPESEEFVVILSRLGEKINAHFNSEETFLKSCGMPAADIEAHVQAHTKIVEQYVELNFELMDGEELLRSEVLQKIKHWIIEHLTLHDLKIRQYLPVTELTLPDVHDS